MLAKIFLELTEYSWFRRTAWKPIYNHLAKRFPNNDWVFMNYGFEPLDLSERPKLDESDEPDRYPLQLYHFLATQTDIDGKTMLEVGSGRGGGASYIARYLKPKEIIGMDIADQMSVVPVGDKGPMPGEAPVTPIVITKMRVIGEPEPPLRKPAAKPVAAKPATAQKPVPATAKKRN